MATTRAPEPNAASMRSMKLRLAKSLLEDYPVPFDFNDLANFDGHRHIRGVRTRPADKEIRQCLQNLVHGCPRGGGIKKSKEA